ncbi:hypothetical protein [Streptomyces solincola]|uniref:hypothetical protein n=1 Tax=Streptomyces solincola TaxID=2100817 RepID=UPI002158BF61|nr:hypothetical protein [Streptomyces solincola]
MANLWRSCDVWGGEVNGRLWRRVRRRTTTLVAGAVLASALPVSTGAAVAAEGAVTPPAKNLAQSASALAAQTGTPVEVEAERTAYSTTLANPDGTFTLSQSTTPQRARGSDGTWKGIDLTLQRRTDGSIGPKSSVVDLSFSAGGSGQDMIRLGHEQGSVTLGWPEGLPVPTLDGATATYPEVMSGVDLQLTATDTGYREMLVVKTAEAAANPALDKVTLTATGDGLDIASSEGAASRPSTRTETPSSKGRPD